MATATLCYIGLGANLGEREQNIRAALKMLADSDAIDVKRTSELLETESLPDRTQPPYLNTVAEIEATLSAEDLLKRFKAIEKDLGRAPDSTWQPRPIDLDLLLYDSVQSNKDTLRIPHPDMHLRSFVMSGLAQLNPDMIHPSMDVTLKELADRLNGNDFFKDKTKPQLVSIAGNIGVGKTTLARKLASQFDIDPIFESYDANPFLPKVYAGQNELALDSQLFFLASRLQQLSPKAHAAGKIAISDYVFSKELIYAEALLDQQQLELYESFYTLAYDKVLSPVLVIYLTGDPTQCHQRIRERDRPYERKIAIKFLENLNTRYEEMFRQWQACPVIRLDMAEFDSRKDADIEWLIDQIGFYVVQI